MRRSVSVNHLRPSVGFRASLPWRLINGCRGDLVSELLAIVQLSGATSSTADERLRRLFVAFVPLFPDASWCGCHGDLVFSTLTVLRP